MLKYDSDEQFRVERGYLNRTRIYLYPAVVLMKSYMPYMKKLKDSLLSVSYRDESIIVYYDRSNTVAIKELLEELRKNGELVDNWMHNESSYAIQIKPDLNYAAFEEGRYSEIYSDKSQINQVFSKESKTKQVVTKDPEYKQIYVNLINEWFNTNYSVESLERRDDGRSVPLAQYDIPPCMNQEILNYDPQKTYRGRIKTPSN